MFQRVLVANRGEIALRIMRTLRELQIESVAVYSEADKGAPHVRYADLAIRLGEANVNDSYLNVEKLLDAAKSTRCDALIPGYGFLSENAAFRRACDDHKLTFIGPSALVMEQMGEKVRARDAMAEASVPLIPGAHVHELTPALAAAKDLGYPVLIKASLGGGGKGMRLVESEEQLPSALEQARSEALRAFGSDAVYLEKAITDARHVEVQILGDQQGNVVHLFERDCSIQRRHQKIFEETPAPSLSDETRDSLHEIALRAARSVGYFSAGTLEFLVDDAQHIYFLEMNTRLQVEHTVTELTTGVDLVREMIRVAAGKPLSANSVRQNGSALQCRIYAEDPSSGFLPSVGTLTHVVEPAGPFVRVDSGVRTGQVITSDYDPLLAKLCVWGPTRVQAIARMRRALDEYRVIGVNTNLDYVRRLLDDPEIVSGAYNTRFIETHPMLLKEQPADEIAAAAMAAGVHVKQQQPHQDRAAFKTSPWVLAHRSRLRRG